MVEPMCTHEDEYKREVIERLSILKIQDNDIVVFRHPNVLSLAAGHNLITEMEEFFEKQGYKNIGCIILEEGMTIDSVLRKEQE